MQGLDNLNIRLNFLGGAKQEDRMNVDKLKALKKALAYSYQAATAELSDGRQFRCLINPDKIKNNYDNKYISIPFEDICLNNEYSESIVEESERAHREKEEIVSIGMKPGDVFTWVENGTDWLVYLRRFEETAYFRAEIRRCKYTIEINGSEYKCYMARNSVNEIDWKHQKETLWNDIDYTATMYITKDTTTEEFFHRFTIVQVANQPWEVQAIDALSSDGIIIIALKEWYNNEFKENINKNEDLINENENLEKDDTSYIIGKDKVYPYDKLTYTVQAAEPGVWEIDSQKIKILNTSTDLITIEVVTGRSGSFNIKYITDNDEIIFPVEILSL